MNAAELILNPDGSIYHLNLLPQDIAHTIILVGDPDRVVKVSNFFDTIDLIKHKREFITHSGWFNQKRITVMSTGIGTDNIDIVINELDALVNVDFDTRAPKNKLTSLNLIRIGTSGSIHPEVPVNTIVVSAKAVGTDALGMYYKHQKLNHPMLPEWSYIADRHPFNLNAFTEPYMEGITLTCPGFYGPQGRVIRAPLDYDIPIEQLHKFNMDDLTFTNLEMETSAIYLLAGILGHKAISFNDILAQRIKGDFNNKTIPSMENLIRAVLKWITSME